MGIHRFLDKYFGLSDRDTSVLRELLGGVTTFMALSYIIFVQPVILSDAGTVDNPFSQGGIMLATCVASAIACLLMAFLANYPIALAPAMGHNVFFATIVCGTMGYSWQQGLAAVFIAGIVFVALSFFGFRARIMDIIPYTMKHAIAGGIGLLLTLIGMEYAGLVVDAPGVLVKFGDITNSYVLLALLVLAITVILMALRVRGAILIGIIAGAIAGCLATACGIPILDYHDIQSFDTLEATSTLLKFDFGGLFSAKGAVTVILTFLFLDIFDTVGTLIGVSTRAGLLENGKLPKARQALLSDATGTVIGSLLGTSTVTSYVESAAGVQAGAKTGLANVATAGCFLLALLFYPFLGIVARGVGAENSLYPVIAPALIIVGSMMLTGLKELDWDDITELFPAFLILVVIPFSMSITEGIAMGFIAYSILKVATGRWKEVHWGFHVVSAILLLRYLFLT